MKIKEIRGQVRIAVKEELPNVLTQELIAAQHKALAEDLHKRIDAIEKMLKDAVKVIDDRSKATVDYLMRSTLSSGENSSEK